MESIRLKKNLFPTFKSPIKSSTINQNFIPKFVRTALRRCSSFSVYKERIYFSSITVGRIAAITDDCKSFAFGLRRFESFPTDFWCAATIMQNYIAVSHYHKGGLCFARTYTVLALFMLHVRVVRKWSWKPSAVKGLQVRILCAAFVMRETWCQKVDVLGCIQWVLLCRFITYSRSTAPWSSGYDTSISRM